MSKANISRRAFLAQTAALGIALHCGTLLAEDIDSTAVHLKSGSLRGLRAGGVRVFRGVPFARPPVGPLRFRPPAEITPWIGARDATQFAAAAMQSGANHLPQSEDCLYLNIWAPQGKGPFPVFVWIHGGGFTGGHSFDPLFDGTLFASEGIVCVTIAYRLGVLGFLDVAPLLGAEYRGSANNGLQDVIAALRWVQANVAEFGGDPSRVTVGGESAGAKLTGILMGVPTARDLFHQMISESGGAERIWSPQDAATVSHAFADQWRTSSDRDTAAILTSPATALIDAQEAFFASWPRHFPLRLEIDGSLVPQLPVETIANGSTRKKRLLIGTNNDESALFIGPHPQNDPTARDLGNISATQFADVARFYEGIYPGLIPEQRRIKSVTAEEYWIPSMRVLDAHVRGGGSAWDYRLDFSETNGDLRNYAYHSLDLMLVWNKPHQEVENASDEATLARQVHAAWVAFIHGKPPAAPGLPYWPQYFPDTRRTMILNTQSRIEEKPHEAELRLWDGFLDGASDNL